jgi:HK97 family phage portal protein
VRLALWRRPGIPDRPDRPAEQWDLTAAKIWGEGGEIPSVWDYGERVSQDTARRLIVLDRCIRIMAENIASMPADAVRSVGSARLPVDRPPRWISVPNPETTPFEFYERVAESLAMDGNAFVLIGARDSLQFPVELWTLHPKAVDVISDDGRVRFEFGPDQERLSKFTPANPLGDVLHIRLSSAGGARGLSPIELHRQGIGMGINMEKAGAKLLAEGGLVKDVITMPSMPVALSREHKDLMRESWKQAHAGPRRAWEPGILTGGAGYEAITVNMDDLQFLESRQYNATEIAMLYGIPPHMVGLVDRSTSWGTGIEQQSIGFVRYTLRPWIVRIEQAFSMLLPRGQTLKFNERSLIRGDSQSEAETFSKLVNAGIINRNEPRSLMDLEPAAGLDEFLYPSNLLPVGAERPAVSEPAPPAEGGE